MKIAVCAKQVPVEPHRLDPSGWRLVREGRPVLDDADAVGVAVAARLAGAADPSGGAGEVVLVSMGPDGEASGLRSGLALGADRAVLVSDPGLAGADALTTARVLAAAVRRLGPVDLVLAGTESTDGYTGVLGAQVAELLGLPAVTFARRLDVHGGVVRAERQTPTGYDEVEAGLPCLVTLTAAAAPARYPSFASIMTARSKPLEVIDLAALGLGRLPPAQEVVAAVPVERRPGGEVVDDGGRAHERIADLLARAGLL